MPKLRNGSKGDSNPDSLDCESGILPLSYRAPSSTARKWVGMLCPHPRLAYPSSIKRGRPVSAAQPPPSDRSQTALCPDCKQTFVLFSEGARGWNTRPHRQCINCYRGRRVRRSGASPRDDANLPPTSEMGAVFAQMS